MIDKLITETFPFYKNKNVLVCGGEGFIGSYLTEILLESEAEVTVVTRNKKDQNVDTQKKLKFIQADFRDLKICKEVVKDFDFVFNAMGKAGGIEYGIKNNEELFFENSQLNLNLLLSLSESNVKRYQYISSVSVYPPSAKNPLLESEKLYFTDDFGYANAKILGEKQCKTFADEFGLKISIIRADNTFGPRDNFSSSSRVIPSLIKKVSQSKEFVEVWGSGKQIRSFIFVIDLVRGLLLGLEKYPIPDPINLSSNERISIEKLIEIILRLSKKNLIPRFDTKKPEGNFERCLDISKARKLLDFTPKWTLEKSLEVTIDWFKEYDNKLKH